jgi:uncharacterized protein (DUF488 family)
MPGVLLHSRAVTVYTLGHSTRTADDFLALLATHRIRGIADVRRYPASRRHPHFARESLAESLAGAGLHYDWLPALGGRRSPRAESPHVAWREPAFRGYADHMETPEFHDGLAALLELAGARPTAILCAEAVPWRCHRQLIADALVARGVVVLHVIDAGMPRLHALSRLARLDGERVVYDVGHLPLRSGSRPGGAVP